MENFDFDKIKEISISSLLDILLSLNGTEISILACILGYALTVNTTVNEQSVIGNFLELMGQFVLTSSAQTYNINSKNTTSNNELQKQINDLYKMFFQNKHF